MQCCQSAHRIVVRAGSGAVELLRCSSCDDQRWCRDGRVLERDEAFDLLASAFRTVTAPTPESRRRAAAAAAERRAARAAMQDDQQAHGAQDDQVAEVAEVDQNDTASHEPRTTVCLPSAQAARETPDLVSLLDGWQVLGSV